MNELELKDIEMLITLLKMRISQLEEGLETRDLFVWSLLSKYETIKNKLESIKENLEIEVL